MKHLSWIMIAALIIGCISSCSHKDDGAINYRKTAITQYDSRYPDCLELKDCSDCPISKNKAKLALWKKYRRGAREDSRIFKGESISIHLQQAFIKHFFEIGFPKANAEIAIVLNAFEMKDHNDFEQNPNEGVKKGRLVYYSDDVERDQFLNFSFLPVYGPITYNGNPIALDIYIMELDAGSKAIKDMISLLANAGSVAYPPASPVLKILDTLGTALMGAQDSTDDRLFHYQMVLHPDRGYSEIDYPILEAGHYVFIRHDDRQNHEDWNEISLNQQTGRLIYHQSKIITEQHGVKSVQISKKPEDFYRHNTYMVVQIQKGFPPTNLDHAQNTYGKFLPALRNAQEKGSTEALKIFEDYLSDSARIRTNGIILTGLDDLKRLVKGKTEARKRIARNTIEELVKMIQKEETCKNNDKAETAECSGILTPLQIDNLLYSTRMLIPADAPERSKISRDVLKNNNGEDIQAIVDAIVSAP